MSLSYRKDIDALRGIAVLSVVFFHAFPGVIKGGYLGVDIFFIISGFLITSILLLNLSRNEFSFFEFYSRRIKRVFPALIFVLLTILISGYYLLYPEEYKQLTLHIYKACTFLSNFQLLDEAGYFDRASDTKPLLHMWSLAIEEQYYLIWPLIICMSWRLNILCSVIVATIGFSFLSNIYFSYHDHEKAFYLPFTRFFELGLGGLLAYLQFQKVSISNRGFGAFFVIVKQYIGIASIGLLMLCLILLSPRATFPGWLVLIPIACSLLIIAHPVSYDVFRLPINKCLIWFGLISYPLYLWHWPILSFLQIMEGHLSNLYVRSFAVLLSVGLAYVTYLYIERPIRFSKPKAWKIVALIFAMISLAACAYITFISNTSNNKSVFDPDSLKWTSCSEEATTQTYCWTKDPTKPVDIIIIGDSHTGHLGLGLRNALSGLKTNLRIAWGGDCLPFVQDEIHPYFSSVCDPKFMNQLYGKVIASSSIQTIVISSYAIAKIQGKAEALNRAYGYDNNASNSDIERRLESFKQGMFETFNLLLNNGKKIIYLVDIPELYFDPKECQKRPIELPWHKQPYKCAISLTDFEYRNFQYHQLIAKAKAAYPNVRFVNMYEYFCDNNYCYAKHGNDLLYGDRDHLNSTGSLYLSSYLKQFLK